VPLIPFLVGFAGTHAVAASAALAVLALFGVGLGLSLFTGRDALRGALRMVLIGGAAGAASFLLGKALGVVVG
jgi:VIT1/CCC1 family predicted Fe2+/Mn2+ transporter